jgi:histidine ammonia-lyase
MQDTVILDGSALMPSQVIDVARGGAGVALSDPAKNSMQKSRQHLESIAGDGQPHYGVNTGFGSLSRHRVDDDHLKQLQVNLIRSHASGIGEPLPEEIVRAMMLILAASLSRGLSGVRTDLVRIILEFLNKNITPAIPSVGSVGASGDLAPLAHLALALIGEGQVLVDGQSTQTMPVLDSNLVQPIQLEAKEGLALINGTHLMAAQASLAVNDADRLVRASLVAGAMSIDGCRASDSYLNSNVAAARRHTGVTNTAYMLRSLLEGSEILPSHRLNDPRVQDPYSLRCQAPVFGAVLGGIDYVRDSLEQELGAVTDNPLVISNGTGAELVSAGNFHGMPIALPLDHLAVSISHIAGMSERRVFFMLSGHDPESGLSPYLATRPGLTSGLMITQYTAAACCNEIIGLATPSTPANVSTSAGIEDYNSFGPRAAAKARRAIELAESVVAIELLCASEALEHHRPLKTGEKLEVAHATIRGRVGRLEDDRPPAPDIEAITQLIREDAFASMF